MSKGTIFKKEFEGKCCCPDLMQRLDDTLLDLYEAVKPRIPIKRVSLDVGFGINNANKNIVCDNIIAIVKEIKKIKGW